VKVAKAGRHQKANEYNRLYKFRDVYNYRCSVCGAELLVNEAIIDAGIALARFNNEYYEGYMPKVGCPGCNGYTMECIDEA